MHSKAGRRWVHRAGQRRGFRLCCGSCCQLCRPMGTEGWAGDKDLPWALQPEMPHKGVGCRYGLRNNPSWAWKNVAVETRRAKCSSEGDKPGVRGTRKPLCSFPHLGVLSTNNLNLKLDLSSPMSRLEACSPGPQGRQALVPGLSLILQPWPLEAP